MKNRRENNSYYIFNSKTNNYLDAQYRWKARGCQRSSMKEVHQSLRVLAEQQEEANRPENWQTLPHVYVDLPLSYFLPDILYVVNEKKKVLFCVQDIIKDYVIQAWVKTTTN